MTKRALPGWLVTTGWAVLGVAALGLPVALVVAALDVVRRSGSLLAQRLVLAVLVLAALALVVGAERGLGWVAREIGIGTAAWSAAGLVGLVLLGVYVPPVGLVLVALGVVVAGPVALAGVGALGWWRWRHGPRPTLPEPTPVEQARARAEERRAAVRARHDLTREAVARGYIGPGFTRGR